MRAIRLISAVAGVALLSGCAGMLKDPIVDEARGVTFATPAQFNEFLALEYRDFASFEADQMYDWEDSAIFARKALAAAAGEQVLPVNPADWGVPAASLDELAQARAALVAALDANARTTNPLMAARAQAKYDCWVEQLEEGWQTEDIAACREQFLAALAAIQAVPVAVEVEVQPMAESNYLVFFEWDEYDLTPAAQEVVAQVIQDARANPDMEIDIVGHTDTSGPADYNQRLSEQRAETVRNALVAAGISPDRIMTAGFGENQPLVPTGDGVREPSNRRAVISFENR